MIPPPPPPSNTLVKEVENGVLFPDISTLSSCHFPSASPEEWVMPLPCNILGACDITDVSVPYGQLPAWHHHLDGHKTSQTPHGPRRAPGHPSNLFLPWSATSVYGGSILQVVQAKYPGLILDSSLCLTPHIQRCRQFCCFHLQNVSTISAFAPSSMLDTGSSHQHLPPGLLQ